MPESFSLLAGAALKSSAVLVIAWAAARLLRNRSAAIRHLIWTAAAAAVLALPFLSAGLPSIRLSAADRLAALAPSITFHTDVAAKMESAATPHIAAPMAASLASTRSFPGWTSILMALWALGAAIGLVQMLAASVALWHRRRWSRPHPAAFCEGVPVLEGPDRSMPMACGVFKPAIFLPPDAAGWTASQREMVLSHELAHVRRGDMATHLIARAALSVYWWNPLSWMAWREFLKERERAADDLVLLSGARASDYAAHLLDIARSLQVERSLGAAAACMARPSQLEGRLLAILDSGLDRKSVARVSALATAVAAVLLVAPFAAIHAQDTSTAPPADVDATIKTALAQKNQEILDQTAAAYVRQHNYNEAQKLLNAALSIREQKAGQNSVEYGEGLVKLADLARRRKEFADASALYTKAALAIGDKPAAARPLLSLGVLLFTKKHYDEAEQNFLRAQAADPAHAVNPLLWMALTEAQKSGHGAEAESFFRQAIAAAGPASGNTIMANELYADYLKKQGRDEEAHTISEQAAMARQEMKAQLKTRPPMPDGVFRVGGGVSAPTLIFKREPEYSAEARAAKYQGTVILAVVIGTDGEAHNIQVVQPLGMELDDEAVAAVSGWKFKPGMRNGVPVPVLAQIEVNFRLL
jgi:TonB family protein